MSNHPWPFKVAQPDPETNAGDLTEADLPRIEAELGKETEVLPIQMDAEGRNQGRAK
jgi:hypothetical protein